VVGVEEGEEEEEELLLFAGGGSRNEKRLPNADCDKCGVLFQ
jgi:hypothetical protein